MKYISLMLLPLLLKGYPQMLLLIIGEFKGSFRYKTILYQKVALDV